MVWAKRGDALGHGSAGDLAQHITSLKQTPPPCEPLWAIREPRPTKFTPLRRRHQGGIYLLVEADAGDQYLVSTDLGDLTGDGL